MTIDLDAAKKLSGIAFKCLDARDVIDQIAVDAADANVTLSSDVTSAFSSAKDALIKAGSIIYESAGENLKDEGGATPK